MLFEPEVGLGPQNSTIFPVFACSLLPWNGIVPIIEGLLAKDREADEEPENFVTTQPRFIPDFDTPRFRLTPSHTAYVKIAEGCNHPCSFCIIPQMRGRHRSRTVASIVAEARGLVAEGVKELNLISQDTTYFGMDRWAEKAGPRAPVDSSRGDSLQIDALVLVVAGENEAPVDAPVGDELDQQSRWKLERLAARGGDDHDLC